MKQYIEHPINQVNSRHRADAAQAAVDTYVEQQAIGREELEVFKCVQVQYVTASSDLTRDIVTCDNCPDVRFFGKYRNKILRRHLDGKLHRKYLAVKRLAGDKNPKILATLDLSLYHIVIKITD